MKRLLLLIIIFISTVSFGQVPNYVPTNGLVGWWGFNGNANDESGNGNNGTVNGATLTTDRFGNPNSAYDFDGVDDFINVGDIDQIENNPSSTFSFWLYSRNNGIQTSSGRRPILSKWNSLPGIPNECSFNFSLADTILRVTFKDDLDTARISDFSSELVLENWYNISIVFDQGIVSYFLNASLIGSNSIPVNQIFNSTREIKFGDWYHSENNNYSTYDGFLDDVGFWNRALSACEIADLYNSELGSLNTSDTQTQTALDSYTWPVNNQTYTQSGTYTAVIPNASGCDSTITLDLTLQFTGLDENESSYVAVYPNPTYHSFILSTKDMIHMNYTLVDIQGKVVLTGKIESTEETVDISKLSKGQYNLVFEDESISPISIIKN